MSKANEFIKRVEFFIKCGDTQAPEVIKAQRLFKKIGGAEGAVLEMFYIRNLSYMVIEKKLFLSPRHVRRLKKSGIEKLEEML